MRKRIVDAGALFCAVVGMGLASELVATRYLLANPVPEPGPVIGPCPNPKKKPSENETSCLATTYKLCASQDSVGCADFEMTAEQYANLITAPSSYPIEFFENDGKVPDGCDETEEAKKCSTTSVNCYRNVYCHWITTGIHRCETLSYLQGPWVSANKRIAVDCVP